MSAAALIDRVRQNIPEQLLKLPIWLLHDARKVPIYASGTRALARRAGEQFTALIRTFQLMEMYRGERAGKPGWHDVIYPWVTEHTAAEISGTAISEPSAANAWWGGFRCHHAHCEHRGMRDIRAWCRALVREIDRRGVR